MTGFFQRAQAIGRPERERVILENQATRDRLAVEAAQRENERRFTSLLGAQVPQTVGAAAAIDPGAAAQGVLGQAFSSQQERPEPAQIRIARFLADPNEDPQTQAIVRQQLNAGATDEQLRELELQNRQAEFELLQSQLAKENRNEATDKAKTKSAVERDLSTIERLAELNADLSEAGILRPGLPVDPAIRRALSSGLAAVKSAFGVNDSRANELIAAFDEFNGLANTLALDSFTRLSGSGTNLQLDTLLRTKPSATQSVEANNAALALMAEAIIDGAQASGIDVLDLEDRKRLIDVLRDRETDEPQATPQVQPSPGQAAQRFRFNPQTGQLEPQ